MSSISSIFEKYKIQLLILMYSLAYFIPIGNRRLWIPDEARYAEISREMIARGDWVVPHLLGLDYFEKPVAGYWLNNISQLLFGETNFAVRFASALCAGLTGWLIYWFSNQLFQSSKKAITATIIYLSCLLVYAIGTYSVLDTMVTLWLNLTLVAFYWSLHAESGRKKLIGYSIVGVAAGLGFLTKGFISLAVPVIVALPYLIYSKKFSDIKYIVIAFISFLVVSLPWALAVHIKAPDYWHYFFWVEHIQRFSGSNAQHSEAFWFYVPVIIGGLLPWLLVVPSALKAAWSDAKKRDGIIFLALWFIIPLLFFSAAKGKLPTYILICFAPLSILIANGLTDLIANQQWRYVRANAWVNIVFGISIALILLLIGLGKVGTNSIYDSTELPALAIATFIFIFWAICGGMSLIRSSNSIVFTALCPLALGILISYALPKSAIYSKLPETFIEENKSLLKSSTYVLSNDPGLAISLAWELGREDIQLYNSAGELTYGLKKTTQVDKLINRENFKEWLSVASKTGSVAVLSHHGYGEVPDGLPKPDTAVTKQRLTLFIYQKHE